MKIRSIILVLCILLTGADAFAEEKKLKVVATIFPVYDFSRQIGKDKIELTMLLPPGMEAHTFSPTPKDVMNISSADVFVYTGKYMEPWAERMLKGIVNKNLLVIDASRNIELSEEHDDHDGKHHHTHEKHSGKDPHIWLDPVLAQTMVKQIAEGFASKDSENSIFYKKNADDYSAKLAELDKQNREALGGCKIKTILYAGHFAFGYFAKRYGLMNVSPYKGFSPDAAPGAKSIAELIEKITQLGAKTVFYEELIDPKVAKLIVEKTGAEMVLLHGAHNLAKEDFEKGITYLSIMQDNLKKLKTGLQCP